MYCQSETSIYDIMYIIHHDIPNHGFVTMKRAGFRAFEISFQFLTYRTYNTYIISNENNDTYNVFMDIKNIKNTHCSCLGDSMGQEGTAALKSLSMIKNS